MSYCRFIEADAYIFDHSSFGLYCMACSLMPLKTEYSAFLEEDITFYESFCAAYDFDMMLAHVAEHRKAGDYIPEYVDERLRFDRDCIHDFNDKGYCKHCWQSEVRWLHVN
jgi:hypothetical protein